ncbi:myeloblastin-like [Suncus etruscus]|uniref:myeloblastin-like n=1 Tax=Suncus etruscus TaxID=109475 RepID=UPI00211051DD|nr:myeloblastin-like [Suncus etruscus]
MGWGQLGNTLRSSDILREVNMSIVTSWCDENVCAFQPHRKAGTCYGDSGGPLMCNSILQALDSFVIRECARRQYPYLFASVSLYVDWI